MLTVHCPRHGRSMLLNLDRISGIVNTHSGIEVHYRCTCGYQGVLLTGRRAHERRNGTATSARRIA